MGNNVIGGTAVALACTLASLLPPLANPAYALDTARLAEAARMEEEALQARLGMAIFDADTGRSWQYRGDERFPLNSTHKVFTCAALLAKVDAKALSLSQTVSIHKEMLVAYSPITEKSPSPKTMTFAEVCQAAMSHSDNTAANVAFDAIGGSTGFSSFMRSLGDEKSRLDRREPELNEATPGDIHDTTTPGAIVGSLSRILLGEVLSASSRAELTQWMLDDRVAGALLRASLPPDWKIADKTGAGGHGSRSIVAAIWPPSRPPLVVGIYVTQTQASMQASDRAIARIGAVLKDAVRR